MPLIDRFRMDDEPILKFKCPLCKKLSPTRYSLIGHLVLEHAEGLCGEEEVSTWASILADSAEFRWVSKKQLYDKD